MIDYSEFLNLTIQHEKLLTEENLKITFMNLDLDNNGTVTVDELQKVFEAGGNKKTDKFWKEFIRTMDLNNDGGIQLNEFMTIMGTLITQSK
jgi:Ca2+-binding EF-hand superfamily protein